MCDCTPDSGLPNCLCRNCGEPSFSLDNYPWGDWTARDWSEPQELSNWTIDDEGREIIPTASIKYNEKGLSLSSLWQGRNIVACWDNEGNQFSLHHAYSLMFDLARNLGLFD